jgi:CheY-like chemotaxis protein
MDINMPVMDGIEATRLIREYEEKNNLKPSRIIAITATMIENYKKELKKIKIDNYLAKPIDIDKLREVI